MPSMRLVWRMLVSRFTSCGVVPRRRASSAGRTFWRGISLRRRTLAETLTEVPPFAGRALAWRAVELEHFSFSYIPFKQSRNQA